jgi:hypothetical protein
MVIGSAFVGINLLLIGWTREVGSWFIDPDEDHYQTLVIWIAVVAMYLLDFSINAVQAACRAIIVDTLPAHKQEIGNAWASRMVAGGHLVGYTMYDPFPRVVKPCSLSLSLRFCWAVSGTNVFQGFYQSNEIPVLFGGYTIKSHLLPVRLRIVHHHRYNMLRRVRTSPCQTWHSTREADFGSLCACIDLAYRKESSTADSNDFCHSIFCLVGMV